MHAFRQALGETGDVAGQNVTVEYHWLEGQYNRLAGADGYLVRRRVAVIATPTNPAAIAAKAATATIPIASTNWRRWPNRAAVQS